MSQMTMGETATVEVLTAEVRVLQIGRRQVTMSVYRQLDCVTPEEIEPFGRVANHEHSEVSVVGRHTATGALVAAHAMKTTYGLDSGGYRRVVADPNPAFVEWSELPLIVLAGLR